MPQTSISGQQTPNTYYCLVWISSQSTARFIPIWKGRIYSATMKSELPRPTSKKCNKPGSRRSSSTRPWCTRGSARWIRKSLMTWNWSRSKKLKVILPGYLGERLGPEWRVPTCRTQRMKRSGMNYRGSEKTASKSHILSSASIIEPARLTSQLSSMIPDQSL